MAWLIVLGFIALPVIEIMLFVKSANAIGVLPTIAVAIAAGMTGIALLRRQGVATLWRAREQLAQGELPMGEVFDGLCIAFAGLMLVLPGFLTDVIGILLLLPPVRAGLRLWLARRFGHAVQRGAKDKRIRIIDADYQVVPPDKDRDRR